MSIVNILADIIYDMEAPIVQRRRRVKGVQGLSGTFALQELLQCLLIPLQR